MIHYTTLNLEQVLDKTGLTVNQLMNAITTGEFPSEFSHDDDGGFYWLEVEVNHWLTEKQAAWEESTGRAAARKNLVELICRRAKAQRKTLPQLAAASSQPPAEVYPYIDIDKSTADLLVIQTKERALGINLPDLMYLIQSHRDTTRTHFVNRVLFGQLKTPSEKTA